MNLTDVTAERRRILEQVAAGDLSPAEAADLLQKLESSGDERPVATQPTHQPDVTAVRIFGTFRALRIEGDPSVKGVIADGPHRARLEDGVMVIEDDENDGEPGYLLFGSPDRSARKKFKVEARINGKEFRFGDGTQPPALKVRMNPDIPLDIEMTAGSVRVTDVHSPINANLTAGTGKFLGIANRVKLSVEAGALTIQGRLTEGHSEAKCSAGKIKVELDRDSDVTIKARATLGKIQLPDPSGSDQMWQGIGVGEREAKIGNGNATLEIEATTGAIAVDLG